ncbi:hypothetical protein M405DRAFT_812365 [Rhizopogon salebrosus TDB-379]|nr:hypothetical protein M405DRAFT_812365 [Rhizopogon salebrosus TDB-379]
MNCILERKVESIHTPGSSLRSDNDGPHTRVQIKNCQTWLREVVVAIVADGTFPQSALTALDEIPKN